MATQQVLLKRNTTNITPPTTSHIVVGEIAISAVDGKLYVRKTNGQIVGTTNEDDAIALAIALG